MLSERKVLIRSAEVLALVGSLCSLAAATGVAFGYLTPTRIESLLAPLLILGFGVFAIAAVLFNEFAHALHGNRSRFETGELSVGEVRQLLHWCPGPTKLAFVVAGAILLITVFSVGAVEWSFGQPFTEKEAKGFPLYLSVFMLVALPVLASASRMPGAFVDHITPTPHAKNGA